MTSPILNHAADTAPPLDDLNLTAVLASYWATRLAKLRKALALELEATVAYGERATAAVATDNAWVPIGTVSRSFPTMRVAVQDEAAFTAWCAERHPTEVTERTVREVRPAFLAGRFAVDKFGRLVGPDGVGEIPGLIVLPGSSSVTVRPDAAVITELWQELGHVVPALLASGADADTDEDDVA